MRVDIWPCAAAHLLGGCACCPWGLEEVWYCQILLRCQNLGPWWRGTFERLPSHSAHHSLGIELVFRALKVVAGALEGWERFVTG